MSRMFRIEIQDHSGDLLALHQKVGPNYQRIVKFVELRASPAMYTQYSDSSAIPVCRKRTPHSNSSGVLQRFIRWLPSATSSSVIPRRILSRALFTPTAPRPRFYVWSRRISFILFFRANQERIGAGAEISVYWRESFTATNRFPPHTESISLIAITDTARSEGLLWDEPHTGVNLHFAHGVEVLTPRRVL